ncbi:MAG: hypothetical protein ACM34E_06345, partial [Acidobacteriota bacterium]
GLHVPSVTYAVTLTNDPSVVITPVQKVMTFRLIPHHPQDLHSNLSDVTNRPFTPSDFHTTVGAL